MNLPKNRTCLKEMTIKALDALSYVGAYNENISYRGMCSAVACALNTTKASEEDLQDCKEWLKSWIFIHAPKAELVGKNYWAMNLAGYKERHKCLSGVIGLLDWIEQQQSYQSKIAA